MQERSIVERVEMLEKKVEALETLPDHVTRVEVQLVQLRDEMRAEFFAIRGDAGAQVTLSALQDAIHGGEGETRRTLRDEIREGDEETRRFMRVLHEEVIARLALMEEGRGPRQKRR